MKNFLFLIFVTITAFFAVGVNSCPYQEVFSQVSDRFISSVTNDFGIGDPNWAFEQAVNDLLDISGDRCNEDQLSGVLGCLAFSLNRGEDREFANRECIPNWQ